MFADLRRKLEISSSGQLDFDLKENDTSSDYGFVGDVRTDLQRVRSPLRNRHYTKTWMAKAVLLRKFRRCVCKQYYTCYNCYRTPSLEPRCRYIMDRLLLLLDLCEKKSTTTK